MTVWLIVVLVLLILLSGFFSASETALMSINRYRLRHLARLRKHRAARRVQGLLEKPERFLGMVLIGNTLANIFASSIVALLTIHWGSLAVEAITACFALAVLIFAEVAPKTVAALHAERVSFLVSGLLVFLLKLFYPFVWGVNKISNAVLGIFGIKVVAHAGRDHLSADELRTMVRESSGKISSKNQNMLLGVLDLNKVTVDDIMVPRNEIVGINLRDNIDDIKQQLTTSQHTRIPVFDEDINNMRGILHLRDALGLLSHQRLTHENIIAVVETTHYVLERTSLQRQLINFQREHSRVGMVVDEYGDILGLVALEDILEEIVGEFTTDFSQLSQEVHPQSDGSYLVDGGISLRRLNRLMQWHFTTSGPKTLSGLIIERLESIPRPATGLLLNNYPVEVVHVSENRVKTARIRPRLRES